MTIIVKQPRYDYCGLSISQYTIISIYCPSLLSTHPNHSWNSWQPSHDLVLVLHSLVSCILPSFLGRHYSRVICHFRKETWLDCQHSGRGNENRIGCSPDQFFPCGEKRSGREDAQAALWAPQNLGVKGHMHTLNLQWMCSVHSHDWLWHRRLFCNVWCTAVCST